MKSIHYKTTLTVWPLLIANAAFGQQDSPTLEIIIGPGTSWSRTWQGGFDLTEPCDPIIPIDLDILTDSMSRLIRTDDTLPYLGWEANDFQGSQWTLKSDPYLHTEDSPKDSIGTSTLDVVTRAPCLDIAVGEIGPPGPASGSRQANTRNLPLPSLLRLTTLWGDLDLSAVFLLYKTLHVPMDSSFGRQIWAEITLSGAPQYRLEINSTVDGEAALYAFDDPDDGDSYVQIGQCRLRSGCTASLSLPGVYASQPVKLMVATAARKKARICVTVHPDG